MTFKFLFVLASSFGTLSVLYANRISCETCSGLSCLLSRGSTLKECSGENDYCISAFCDSLVLARGCASVTKSSPCPSPAAPRMLSCYEEKCDSPQNSHIAHIADARASGCVQCNQGNTNACLLNAFTLPSTPCPNGETQCYTKMDNGIISRGCLNQLSQGEQSYCLSEEFGENCAICSGNGCNRDIFPDDRLKCHQCDSATDPSCNTAKSPRTATFCADYLPEMQCLTVIKSNKSVQRMCTNIPSNHCNGAISCSRCSIDGCNNEGITFNQIDQLDKCPSPTPSPSPTTHTTPTPRPSQSTTPATTPTPSGVSQLLPVSLLATCALVLFHFAHFAI